jgi:hypothetical protein
LKPDLSRRPSLSRRQARLAVGSLALLHKGVLNREHAGPVGQ